MTGKSDNRRERLAAALRENLKRRKARTKRPAPSHAAALADSARNAKSPDPRPDSAPKRR